MAESGQNRTKKRNAMANDNLRIILAQQDFLLGDIFGNTDKIIATAQKARDELNADVIVFPELATTSYPPEDLLLRPGLHERVAKSLRQIQMAAQGIDLIVGHPHDTEEGCFNAASVFHDQKLIASSHKRHLPNYSVFDEQRYFKAGVDPCVVDFNGLPIGIIVCEDLWFPDPTAHAVADGAKLIIAINASPFDANKSAEREDIVKERIKENYVPIAYLNLVSGQDELIFDGASFVVDKDGEVCCRAKEFEEELLIVDINVANAPKIAKTTLPPVLSHEERIYKALVFGTRDYIKKNGFKEVIIGLSGGIDSALTLAIAADAIGPDKIHAVMLPSRYTAQSSIDDAKKQAETMGVNFSIHSIEPAFEAFLTILKDEFKGLPVDATEENIQARCRGLIIMALSNKTGAIVLTTGNKSEMSVGYATLYGDMAGGFSVLKDVPKTLVYELSNFRNQSGEVIPQHVIDKAPSAELAPDQTDQDVLPPYDRLDKMLEMYIEQDLSVQNIIDAGFDEEEVRKIAHMVDVNEYKRRQAPPGIRITQRAFGRDRRYPITSGYGRGH